MTEREPPSSIEVKSRNLLLDEKSKTIHQIGIQQEFSVAYYEKTIMTSKNASAPCFEMFLAAMVPNNGKILGVCYNYQ